MAFNRKARLRGNIEAIKLLFELEKTKAEPTPEQREILQSYCGFGALKCILNPTESLSDIALWSKSDLELFPLTVQLHSVIKNNTTQGEYKQYFNSLKNSILTAFYTPESVIDSLASSLGNNGILATKFLDPSAGQGAFMRSFARVSPVMESTNFEKDLLTGKLLDALYPKANVNIKGFESISPDYKGYFDVVASNIPFGDVAVFDPEYVKGKDPVRMQASKAIHNYFFVKGLDTLREGGVMAFITSQGVMNSPTNAPIREMLMNNANLISAIRLPNNLFSDIAGTDVGSDLVVLQKNSEKQSLTPQEELFIQTSRRPSGSMLNAYFKDLSHIVHTEWKQDTDPYGRPSIVFKHSGGAEGIAKDIQEILSKDIKLNFNQQLYAPEQKVEQVLELEQKPLNTLYDLFGMSVEQRKSPKRTKARAKSSQETMNLFNTNQNPEPEIKDLTPSSWTKEMLSHYKDGSIVEDNAGQLGHLREFRFGVAMFHPLDLPALQQERIKAYIPMRDSYFELYNAEQNTQREHSELRSELNTHYDNFVKKYGNINAASNAKFILMDSSGREICALERSVDGAFVKADILDHPVAFSQNETLIVEDANEALSASLNKHGGVHLEYMAELTSLTKEQLIEQLEGRIYYNPMIENYEIADRFIAGNVVEKAEKVDSYLLENPNDKRAQEALQALRDATPRAISFEELDFNFGERWIPTGIYSRYASYLYDTEVRVTYSENLDDYDVVCRGYNANIYDKYSVKTQSRSYDGTTLMTYALLNTVPDITKIITVDGEQKKVRDSEAIQLANSKIDEIRNGFTDWLSEQTPEFKDRLADMYNKKFNCFVRPEYDGSHQKFPNLDLKALGIPDLYKSQKDAIWMIKQNSGGIADHEVGTGKTLIMCVAAYEMKRLGLVNKPLIIGLKANLRSKLRQNTVTYCKCV